MKRSVHSCGALGLLCVLLGTLAAAPAAHAADEFEKFALSSAGVSLSSNQAGAHADLTTVFTLTEKGSLPYAQTRDVEVHLPPGMIGNPQSIPPCSVAQLGDSPEESECPVASQVGVNEIRIIEPVVGTFLTPLYNMNAPKESDIVARLGFFAGGWPAFINVRVDPTDYSLVASVEGAPSAAGLLAAKTTLWGVPAAPVHDALRLTPTEGINNETPGGGRSAGLPEAPFLSNPTDCSLHRQVTFTARSYQLPGQPSTMSAPFPEITGCGKLDFRPRFSLLPTNTEASAPTGIDAELVIPQDETPQGLATSSLKAARVTLPQGLTINPAAASGLEGCTVDQVGFGRNEPAHCPDAAQIGSVEVDVPALEHPISGFVYQRTPEPGKLFRFWVVADELGVHLKLPAEIETDRANGQLTTLFLGIPTLGGNPQVPVAQLNLHVFGGPRAPLSTPGHCGTFQTRYTFAPWSGGPSTEGDTPMQITSGCGKGGFSPKLVAGSLNYDAGSFSPFTFTLTRSDGEANPQQIALHLPEGLLAKLGGVPLCSDADASTGNCASASRIGSLAVAVGVGGAPLWIPQPGKPNPGVYLSGPYKGAPYSVVSVVPAQAGPFDLGTVVNRAGIYIDPETALVAIKTDPLPQILEGVPVTYRTLHVEIDRESFTLNPTSCAHKKVTAALVGSSGEVAEPEDGFQATNCAKLPYSPKLKIFFTGSTKRTGNPAVHAVLKQKPHQANTKSATVLLPAGEFIDNAHVNNPCTRPQFAEGRCPKKSILGYAQAVTPLLTQPLKGPVYFRSNGGARQLPDLVADLRGQVHITLVGYIDSVKTGPGISRVRTRFANVPDAPITKFTMDLFGGARGLIENSHNLCAKVSHIDLKLQAQNGARRSGRPAIRVPCRPAKKP